jgi:hypothetical protein
LKWLLLRRRRLGEVGDVAALEHVLPVLPIEISVLDLRDCATVDAGHRDRHAVRVGPRRVEGCDAADLAEGMLRRVGFEGVGGDELLGAVLKLAGASTCHRTRRQWQPPRWTMPEALLIA